MGSLVKELPLQVEGLGVHRKEQHDAVGMDVDVTKDARSAMDEEAKEVNGEEKNCKSKSLCIKGR